MGKKCGRSFYNPALIQGEEEELGCCAATATAAAEVINNSLRTTIRARSEMGTGKAERWLGTRKGLSERRGGEGLPRVHTADSIPRTVHLYDPTPKWRLSRPPPFHSPSKFPSLRP